MILVAIGANLPSRFGTPQDACLAALSWLEQDGDVKILERSHWWETAPVPISDQPWYVNGVVSVETDLSPEDLLQRLHLIEAGMGRVRTVPNAPRVIDLDLLAYGETCCETPLTLPHPRLHLRMFVLGPLCDIAPDWRHPTSNRTAKALRDALPAADRDGASVRRLP